MEALTVTGQITEIGQVTQLGDNQVKQIVITDGHNQYPKSLCISVWNGKIAHTDSFKVGDSITAKCDVQSKYRNGYWNNQVSAFDIRLS